MKSRISALMDGELEAHELPPVLDAMAGSEDLKRDWFKYGLIGDAMRREKHLEVDLSARVLAALHNEPTVLAPVAMRSVRPSGPARRMMAMAAGVAGVGVVAWMGLSESPSPLPLQQTPVAVLSAPASAKPVAAQQASSRRMREYLVAHQTYAPASQMQGGTRYVRTVAAER